MGAWNWSSVLLIALGCRKVAAQLRGFTLVELIVVILVLSIVAGVALVGYDRSVEKAHISAAKVDTRQWGVAALADLMLDGASTFTRAGFLAALDDSDTHVVDGQDASGTWTLHGPDSTPAGVGDFSLVFDDGTPTGSLERSGGARAVLVTSTGQHLVGIVVEAAGVVCQFVTAPVTSASAYVAAHHDNLCLTGTAAAGDTLSAPTQVAAVVLGESVHVSWQPSTSAGVVGYRVYRSAGANGPRVQVGGLVAAADAPAVQDQPGSGTWLYTVVAVAAAAEARSAAVSVVVPAPDSVQVTYPSTSFTVGAAHQQLAPQVSGSTAGGVSYSYTGTLPDGVTFSQDTGVFTGPGATGWASSGATSASGGAIEAFGTAAQDDGSAFVVGRFSGTATFGTTTLTAVGGLDVFVAKLSAAGSWQWATQAGGASTDSASGVAVGGDGSAYVVGGLCAAATFGSLPATVPSCTTGFVAKVDADGTWLWVRTDPRLVPKAVAVTGAGTAVVAGAFWGSMTLGSAPTVVSAGLNDVVVAAISSTGSWTSAVRAGTAAGSESASGVAVASDGSVRVVGDLGARVAFGSAPCVPSSGGTSSVVVASLDLATSGWVWLTCAGTGASDYDVAAVDVAVDGSAVVAGWFSGSATFGSLAKLTSAGGLDAFVAKVDPSGAWMWAVRGGGSGSGSDQVRAVSVASDGSVLVGGNLGASSAQFGSTPALVARGGSSDAFAGKLTAGGEWVWAVHNTLEVSGNEYSRAVAWLPDGSALVVGSFGSQVGFGSTTLTSQVGQSGLFAAKVGGSGTWAEATSGPQFPALVSVLVHTAAGTTSIPVTLTAS